LQLVGIAGGEYPVAPKTDSPDDKGAAEMIQELVDEIEDFHGAVYRLATAKFRGDAWEYPVGQFEETVIGGQAGQWYVVKELLNADRFRFRQVKDEEHEEPGNALGVYWQFYSIIDGGWKELEHPEWFVRIVFDRSENALGYGSGWQNLLAMMYYYTRALEVTNEESIDALQRWAQGLLHIKIDEDRAGSTDKSTSTLANEWITEMKKHLGQHILVHSSRDEVEVEDGPSTGHEIIKDLREYFVNSIAFLINFGVLPSGSSHDVGSNARAEEEGDQMHEGFVFDRKTMAEGLTRSLIGLLWDLNKERIHSVYPTARMPHFEARLEKVASQEERIARLDAAARNKIPVRKEDVYEDLGYPMPTAGDESKGILPDDIFDWEDLEQQQMGNGIGALFKAPRGSGNAPDIAGDFQKRMRNGKSAS
jgi:hypothetical protein